jgi:hypothetical protein
VTDAPREPGRQGRPDDAEIAARLAAALRAPDASARLQAALTAGTRPDPALVEGLIHRCRVEPDLNVREMLTWALIRHDPELTIPPLIAELTSPIPQCARRGRRAWRTSSGLVDGDRDPAGARWLSQQLASQLGRGGRDTQASLARAFASVGRAALPVLERSRRAADARVRIHALAVIAQLADPELRFDDAVDEARRASFGAHLARSPDGGPSPR